MQASVFCFGLFAIVGSVFFLAPSTGVESGVANAVPRIMMAEKEPATPYVSSISLDAPTARPFQTVSSKKSVLPSNAIGIRRSK